MAEDNFFVLESVRILNLVVHLTVFAELREMVPGLGGIILAIRSRAQVFGEIRVVSI